MKRKTKQAVIILTVLNPSTNVGADVVVTTANGTIATSAVTANGDAGIITTAALTTAALTWEAVITFTNSRITSSSIILFSIDEMAGVPGTNGVPTVIVDTRTTGACTLYVGNTHPTAALSGAFKFSYLVINTTPN